jgi:hypothetical protein
MESGMTHSLDFVDFKLAVKFNCHNLVMLLLSDSKAKLSHRPEIADVLRTLLKTKRGKMMYNQGQRKGSSDHIRYMIIKSILAETPIDIKREIYQFSEENCQPTLLQQAIIEFDQKMVIQLIDEMSMTLSFAPETLLSNVSSARDDRRIDLPHREDLLRFCEDFSSKIKCCTSRETREQAELDKEKLMKIINIIEKA